MGYMHQSFIFQFCFNQLNNMFRKLIHFFPKNILQRPNIFFFSQKNTNNDQKPSKMFSKPYKSQMLQRFMLRYIKTLKNKTVQNEEQYLRILQSKTAGSSGGSGQNDNTNDANDKNENRPSIAALARFALISFVLIGLLADPDNQNNGSNIMRSNNKLVNEQQMLNLLKTGAYHKDIIITRKVLSKNRQGHLIFETICIAKQSGKVETPTQCVVNNLHAFLTELENINHPYQVAFNYPPVYDNSDNNGISLTTLLMISAVVYLGVVIYRRQKEGKGFNFGNNQMNQMLNLKKFEPIKPQNIKTYFKDVAGMHEAKQEITQFVDFLKNPDKYLQMGAKIPKGALLTGPPGTGKTLLARACAGQAGVPFFYVSGSQFVQKYVGLGANRVRSLFQSASKAAPSIIFIDEIDAIGKKRNSGPFANQQKENTLNQLLVNMDGFDTKSKVIVMGATNIKDSLDPALLRPGRFDRAVEIGLPSFQERVQILKVHLLKVKFAAKYTIDDVAKKVSVLTPGFSGAQLANICNQAAILAARNAKQQIDLPQFQKATERVMAGLQKRNLFSEEQKQCLAYYQCGRAVASWFTQSADPVIKISISPYSKQGTGYSHQIKDQIPLKTKQQLLSKVVCFLAGRTSQLQFKGYTTSNGDADMKKAKRLVSVIVMKLGMSSIGTIGFPDIQYVRKPYSNHLQKQIDQQIQRIFKECQQKATVLVKQRTSQIEKLKKLIMEKETLTHNSLKQVLGERPFSQHENYQKFLKDSSQVKQNEGQSKPQEVNKPQESVNPSA